MFLRESLPTGEPTGQPSGEPSGEPTTVPSACPSSEPSTVPSGEPTAIPSSEPSGVPSGEPTGQPTSQPSGEPTGEPTSEPTGQPSGQPTAEPSGEPTGEPTSMPSGEPTSQPSGDPTGEPTSEPSGQPTGKPSGVPTAEPSGQPSGEPSGHPTSSPTAEPSSIPSSEPSGIPTSNPTLFSAHFSELYKGGDNDNPVTFSVSKLGFANRTKPAYLSVAVYPTNYEMKGSQWATVKMNGEVISAYCSPDESCGSDWYYCVSDLDISQQLSSTVGGTIMVEVSTVGVDSGPCDYNGHPLYAYVKISENEPPADKKSLGLWIIIGCLLGALLVLIVVVYLFTKENGVRSESKYDEENPEPLSSPVSGPTASVAKPKSSPNSFNDAKVLPFENDEDDSEEFIMPYSHSKQKEAQLQEDPPRLSPPMWEKQQDPVVWQKDSPVLLSPNKSPSSMSSRRMPSSIREASDSADSEDNRNNVSSDDNEVSNIATSGQQHGVVSPWRIGSMGDMSDLDLDS
jgi:hypothetical protein